MKIAIIGFGSVGKGIVRVLREKDLGITVTGLADSKSGILDNSGIVLGEALAAKEKTGRCGDGRISPDKIVTEADYDVLVEVSPTNALTGEPATGYIRKAIARKKHIVTSNKGPISLYFQELMDLAEKSGVKIRYEATVGGGIPIMHTLEHGLSGNSILGLLGVFNGTCNYILSRMADEGLTYEQALLEAREMGYAEADPTYDVKGIDAAIKLVILANTIWKNGCSLKDVDLTGIDLLTPDAMRLAEAEGCTIRLIGEVIPSQDLVRVSPRILPTNHPLVVEGTLNAITLGTDLAGEITLIGKGAGSRETASAVIGDILYLRDRHVTGS